MTPDAGYLSLKALSQYSGLCVRTLRSYLTDRVHPLPCYRFGRKILVRATEFDAWAAHFRHAERSTIKALAEELLRGL